jgi:phosphatidylglycerol:prolipoprotein diacylglycerol transferase
MALVVLGILAALLTQSLVLRSLSVRVSHALPVSLLAVVAGAVAAKAWYTVLHRREGKRDGWCIQGLVAGVAITAPLLLWLFDVATGPYLDALAPALLFGMAIGRVGCFLTGCCSGRPSRSRWAIWSSNRTVCARRVPVQLLESALAALVGVIALVVVLASGPRHGEVLVASVAAYTLIRQGLLLLREERRRSRRGAPLIAALAAVILAADSVMLVLT